MKIEGLLDSRGIERSTMERRPSLYPFISETDRHISFEFLPPLDRALFPRKQAMAMMDIDQVVTIDGKSSILPIRVSISGEYFRLRSIQRDKNARIIDLISLCIALE